MSITDNSTIANIVVPDIRAGKAIVHITDAVVMPPTAQQLVYDRMLNGRPAFNNGHDGPWVGVKPNVTEGSYGSSGAPSPSPAA